MSIADADMSRWNQWRNIQSILSIVTLIYTNPSFALFSYPNSSKCDYIDYYHYIHTCRILSIHHVLIYRLIFSDPILDCCRQLESCIIALASFYSLLVLNEISLCLSALVRRSQLIKTLSQNIPTFSHAVVIF